MSSRLPLLVIEDEPAVMSFLTIALERAGYTVVPAETGADAVKLIESREFFGVISDMRTPGGMSGADVHSWIKQHRTPLAGKMIFITGDTASEDTAHVLESTGVPYIEKPFRIVDLISKVEAVIGKP